MEIYIILVPSGRNNSWTNANGHTLELTGEDHVSKDGIGDPAWLVARTSHNEKVVRDHVGGSLLAYYREGTSIGIPKGYAIRATNRGLTTYLKKG